jgi:hypothetical protein
MACSLKVPELLYKKQSNTHYEYTLLSECANRYMWYTPDDGLRIGRNM